MDLCMALQMIQISGIIWLFLPRAVLNMAVMLGGFSNHLNYDVNYKHVKPLKQNTLGSVVMILVNMNGAWLRAGGHK